LHNRVGVGSPRRPPTPPCVRFRTRRFLSAYSVIDFHPWCPISTRPYPHGFRPLLYGNLGPLTRLLLKTARLSIMDALTSSALHRLVTTTTSASADFCRTSGNCFSAPLHRISPSAGRQTSPGNSRDLHPIYPPHLQPHPPDGYRTLKSHAFSPGCDCLSMRFLFRRARTLPTAFFRFRVTPDTLAVRLTVSTIRVRRGLAPPSQRSTTTVDHMSLARHAPYQAHTDRKLTGIGRSYFLVEKPLLVSLLFKTLIHESFKQK
jgi:hypothetical protein